MASEERIPSLCANGCGFFGSPATMDLCSVCYKAYYAKKIKEDQAALEPPKPVESAELSSVDPMSLSNEAPPARVAVKNRCSMCRKRVGLTGFVCRCASTFCGAHRYPEEHKCEYDFKTKGREDIAKANPVVMKGKLENKIERFA